MANVGGIKGIQIVGYDELEKQLTNLGKNFPKAKIRQAARKSVKIPLQQAKKNAPVESGLLKKSLVAVEEKKWIKNKKLKKAVFQVYFDRAYTKMFKKDISEEGLGSRGGQTKVPYAYYPYSQEYGFHTAPDNRHMPPKAKFMTRAIESTQDQTLETLVDHMLTTIQKMK